MGTAVIWYRQPYSMMPRYSILGMMEFTAVVAVIVAADRALLGAGLPVIAASIAALNAMTGAYAGIRLRRSDAFEKIVKSTRLATACVSLLNSMVVAVIVADGLNRGTGGEYFTWSRDWPRLAFSVVGVTIVSISAGMFLGMVFAVVFGRPNGKIAE